VHEIRKYKFYEIACSDVLFVVHRYHYKFVGLAGSGIDSATTCKLCSQSMDSIDNFMLVFVM